MIVACKKIIILAFVLIICVHKVQASLKTKFSFKKTFLTPKELYEKRNEELDQCEILERSNFSSNEDDEKEDHKDVVPRVVANAHIHVRFGEETIPEPTVGNEKFIGASSKEHEKINRPSHQGWYFQPRDEQKDHHECAKHYYNYHPSYYHFGPYGFGPCPIFGCNFPYHHISSHDPYGNLHNPRWEPNNDTEIPYVNRFARNEREDISKKIRNQDTLTTEQHLELLERFCDVGELKEKNQGKEEGRISNDEPTTPIIIEETSITSTKSPTTVSPEASQHAYVVEQPNPCKNIKIHNVDLTSHTPFIWHKNNENKTCQPKHDQLFWHGYPYPPYGHFNPWMFWNPWFNNFLYAPNPHFHNEYFKPFLPINDFHGC